MAITRISTASGGAAAQAIADLIDAGTGPGTIDIYTAGSGMPATPETAVTDQVLLGTLTCSDPCGTVTSKTLTFSAITQDSAADATGTAAWARIRDSNGTAVIDVDVSATGGGGTLQLNTVSIVAGGPIAITSLSVTVG